MRLIATQPSDYWAFRPGGIWRGCRVPVGGLEPAPTLKMLAGLSARLQAAQGWGTWVGVVDHDVVVSIAVKRPVTDARVEIGYGVALDLRGRGFATMAVLAVLTELHHKGVQLVTAESAVANPASARVLAKTGFVLTGKRPDPLDGVLNLWERVL